MRALDLYGRLCSCHQDEPLPSQTRPGHPAYLCGIALAELIAPGAVPRRKPLKPPAQPTVPRVAPFFGEIMRKIKLKLVAALLSAVSFTVLVPAVAEAHSHKVCHWEHHHMHVHHACHWEH
jgi:hypothetical protein